jgi:integrase
MPANAAFLALSKNTPAAQYEAEIRSVCQIVSLQRTKSGAWKGRKTIPADVRDSYARLYGQRWEAMHTLPASLSPGEAKAAHAEWLAEIEERIATLRNPPAPGFIRIPRAGRAGAVAAFIDMLAEGFNAGALAAVIAGDPSAHIEVPTVPALPGVASTPTERKMPAVTEVPKVITAEPARVSAVTLFDSYVADAKVAATTASRWRPVFDALDALDQPIIDTAAAQRWLDSLKTPKRSARTVRDIWLSAARTVYAWAKRRGMVKVNPFDGCVVEVPRTKVTRETGRAFTEAEARTILHAAQRVPLLPIGTKGSQWAACRRWVPWLCAYTGARVGELTQLRAGDVQARQAPAGSIWVLRLTPDAGTIKTGRARTVPLHADLVRQGFPELAQRALAALGPEAPLFFRPPQGPSRNPNYRGPATKARERLAAWVRSLGVDDPGISPNHAWRHLFKTVARRAGIESGSRDAIVGHAARSTAESYEHVTVEDMAEALKQFPRYTIAAPPHNKNAEAI